MNRDIPYFECQGNHYKCGYSIVMFSFNRFLLNFVIGTPL